MQEPQPATQKPINVQNTQFPQFTVQPTDSPTSNANMDLLMGVSLDVSVEIGQTKRKIKDIIDFGQGTVIELNKQAGAPVDIVVNGRLLARGDVVAVSYTHLYVYKRQRWRCPMSIFHRSFQT